MKYALALGGGGARGAFEAGVWRALRELGKDIAAIAGTSVGAINGAAFAAGADVETLWHELQIERLFPKTANGDMLSAKTLAASATELLRGGFDTLPLRNMLKELISETAVRTSGIDYGLCAYSASEKVSRELFCESIPKGRLIDYVTASACFPLFRPVKIRGEELTDGGTRNNLPVNMLTERGYNTIIAVHVSAAGITRGYDRDGVNVIEIKNTDTHCTLMDFSPEATDRSIRLGYYECLRAFGAYPPIGYFIRRSSYLRAVSRYGAGIIGGIAGAAELIGLDMCREYTFSELVRGVIERYTTSPALAAAVRAIESGARLDALYKNYSAANAVVYMKRHSR